MDGRQTCFASKEESKESLNELPCIAVAQLRRCDVDEPIACPAGWESV